jgi:hypothetical protein
MNLPSGIRGVGLSVYAPDFGEEGRIASRALSPEDDVLSPDVADDARPRPASKG